MGTVRGTDLAVTASARPCDACPDKASQNRAAPIAGACVSDPLVDHPQHYQRGGIETIDYIRASLTPEQFEGYCIGNALKYLSRYRDKDGLRDLGKAKVYLGWALDAYCGYDPTQIGQDHAP